MQLKEFLKQNFKKSLILVVVLLIISTGLNLLFPSTILFPIKSFNTVGFPLPFYQYDVEPWAGENPFWRNKFLFIGFFIDLIFLFIISLLIILIYSRYKK